MSRGGGDLFSRWGYPDGCDTHASQVAVFDLALHALPVAFAVQLALRATGAERRADRVVANAAIDEAVGDDLIDEIGAVVQLASDARVGRSQGRGSTERQCE